MTSRPIETKLVRFECVACGETKVIHVPVAVPLAAEPPLFCSPCEAKYPESLLKAFIDPFTYALKLRTGEVLEFQSARASGDFVHLVFEGECESNDVPFRLERGLDVRVSAIVWCTDNPWRKSAE
jgi:hypothetical protein